MPSSSYANQPPHNGPGHYPMGPSTHQPPATSLHQQQYYGAPTSSHHQQSLAGPMPSGKQPEQFPGHAPGMMSGGGVPPMGGPPLSSGQMPAMNIAGNYMYLYVLYVPLFFYMDILILTLI